MATVKNTCVEVPADGGDVGFLVSWVAMANGDVGDLFNMTGFVPLSVQVEGIFGAAGSCALEGSNDGVNSRAVHDGQGTAIALTAAGIKAVGDVTRYNRPNVTAGDGTTALTVSLLIRKAKAR